MPPRDPQRGRAPMRGARPGRSSAPPRAAPRPWALSASRTTVDAPGPSLRRSTGGRVRGAPPPGTRTSSLPDTPLLVPAHDPPRRFPAPGDRKPSRHRGNGGHASGPPLRTPPVSFSSWKTFPPTKAYPRPGRNFSGHLRTPSPEPPTEQASGTNPRQGLPAGACVPRTRKPETARSRRPNGPFASAPHGSPSTELPQPPSAKPVEQSLSPLTASPPVRRSSPPSGAVRTARSHFPSASVARRPPR